MKKIETDIVTADFCGCREIQINSRIPCEVSGYSYTADLLSFPTDKVSLATFEKRVEETVRKYDDGRKLKVDMRHKRVGQRPFNVSYLFDSDNEEELKDFERELEILTRRHTRIRLFRLK